MKFHDGFDGRDENLKVFAASADDDDVDGDGYEGDGSFDDDDEEEEVIVTMTSDDDEDLDRLEDEVDDLLEPEPHAEEAVIAAAPPSPVVGYTPAATPSKTPVKSAASTPAPVVKKS